MSLSKLTASSKAAGVCPDNNTVKQCVNLSNQLQNKISFSGIAESINTRFVATSNFDNSSFYYDTWRSFSDGQFVWEVMQLEKLLSAQYGEVRLGRILRTVLCNVRFYFNAQTIYDKILVVYNFICSLADAALIDLLMGMLQQLARGVEQRFPEQFKPTSSFSDFLSESADKLRNVQTSIVFISLNKILACAVAHELLGDVIPSKLLLAGLVKSKDIHEWRSREDVPTMIAELFSAISNVIKSYENRHKEEHDFDCLTDYEWIECARWLAKYEYTRHPVAHDVPPGYVSNAQWLKNLELCERKYIACLSKDYTLRSIMTSLHKSVLEMVIKARCSEYGERPLPFNIGLTSEPGTGKSTWIAKSLIQTALNGLGVHGVGASVSDIDKQTCTVNQSDKFMSTYHPHKHLAVILDEMGSQNPKFVQSNEVMTNITSLLGEGDFYLNSAALNDKGKNLFRPYVNVCISNERDFGIQDYIQNPEAFFRRFSVAATIRIKPCFMKKGYNGEAVSGIDYTKLGADRTEAVEFKFLQGTPSGFKEIDTSDQHGWISYKQFSDIVMMIAREHASKVSALNTTHSYMDQLHGTRCEHGLFDCSLCDPSGEDTYVRKVAHKMGLKRSLPEAFLATSAFVSPVQPEVYSHFGSALIILRDMLIALVFFIAAVALSFYGLFSPRFSDRLSRYKRRYRGILRDIAFVRDTFLHADRVLDRYYEERTRALRSVAMASCVIIAALAAYKFATRKSEDKPIPTGSATTIDPELEGSAPTSNGEGNPWDYKDGFLHSGPASSTPAEIALAKIKRNIIQIRIVHAGKMCVTHALGIRDQYALVVWHSISKFTDPECTISVLSSLDNGKTVTSKFCMKGGPSLVTKIGTDLGMVKLCDVNAFRDITKLVCVKAQYAGSLQRIKAISMFYRGSNVTTVETIDTVVTPREIEYVSDSVSFKHQVLSGPFDTPFNGLCGSPLVSIVGSQVVLNGVQCAGSVNVNVGAWHILDLPMLQKGFDYFSNKGVYVAMSAVGFDSGPSSDIIMPYTRQSDRFNHTSWLSQDERGNTQLFGSFSAAQLRKPKTSVVWFPHKEELFKTFPVEYHHDLIPPVFRPLRIDGEFISPEKNALKDLARQVTGINMQHLEAAIDSFVEKLCSVEEFEQDHILDLYSCINGSSFSNLVSSMPKSTSAGFPDGGKKYEHLVPDPREQAPDGYSLTPEMEEKFTAMLERASRGERNGVIYKTCLKDEARSRDKVAERKIRLFTLGPMNFFLLCKKFFGMFSSIFLKNFLNTETVGGVNPFSPDWGRIYKRLQRFLRVINGDYSKFDKKSSILMIMAAFTVIIRVKEYFLHKRGLRLSLSYRLSMLSIASDIADPLLLLDRDLLYLGGSLSSGVLLTFLINNIINSLYIRLAFYHCFIETRQEGCMRKAFDDNVEFFALGDDNTYSVSDTALPYFNFRTVQMYFHSIGIKYTNAAKTDDVYGSLPISEATIGKRKWVYDEEYQIWKCPIEKASILKSITIGVASKSITLSEQENQALDSVVVELSQYPREEFEGRVAQLRAIYPERKFPTYEELMTKQQDAGVTPWVPKEVQELIAEFVPLS